MSKIVIVTDSTANLSKEYVEEHNIKVVPLNIHWGDKNFKDNVDITPTEFYERLVTSGQIPKTSQPSMQDFKTAFEEVAPDCEAIVVPLLSSVLSGTIASALSAQQECTEAPLEIVDTKETAAGLALVVIAVVEAVEAGKDLAEVKQVAEQVASQVKFTFMVDTLEYLHKGGRIGGGKRFLGTALKIKPILMIDDDGKIEALEQVRTNRKAMERLVQIAAEQAGGKPAHVGIIHANAPDAAKEFKKMLEAEVDCKYVETFGLSPVIGVHVGPGAIGCAIYPDLG